MVAHGGDEGGDIRLAELVASLSLATDLGRGQPMEHCIRETLIALRLATLLGLDDFSIAVVLRSRPARNSGSTLPGP